MFKKTLATLGGFAAAATSAFAEGESGSGGYTVPAGVQTAIDDVSNAATGLAASVAPAMKDIVLAFLGIAALLWVGRYLWRKAQGRS